MLKEVVERQGGQLPDGINTHSHQASISISRILLIWFTPGSRCPFKMPVYEVSDDLSEHYRCKDGDKVKKGNDDDAQAYLVDPWIAEISFIPIGRFDEMLNVSRQAPFIGDFAGH
jgi:hypothetical protein